MTKKEILKGLKEGEIEEDELSGVSSHEMVEIAVNNMRERDIINFELALTEDGGFDWHLEARAYFEEIMKDIIIDYNFGKVFESYEDLAERILQVEEKIKKVKEKIN